MGFFSWKCAKCKGSIPAYPHAGFDKKLSDVVLVLPDNTVLVGTYDGYGGIETEVGTIDVYETIAPYYFGRIDATRDDVFNTNKLIIAPDGSTFTVNQFRYDEPLELFAGKSLNDLRSEGYTVTTDFDVIQEMIKIVRQKHYMGESYDQLETSESCENQGFFY
jgi:hypothetical protein